MASQHLRDALASPAAWLSRRLFDLRRRVRDPYRPELHYMRGPGPKWHEKQAVAARQAPAPSP